MTRSSTGKSMAIAIAMVRILKPVLAKTIEPVVVEFSR